jgi:hypothetical protein
VEKGEREREKASERKSEREGTERERERERATLTFQNKYFNRPQLYFSTKIVLSKPIINLD